MLDHFSRLAVAMAHPFMGLPWSSVPRLAQPVSWTPTLVPPRQVFVQTFSGAGCDSLFKYLCEPQLCRLKTVIDVPISLPRASFHLHYCWQSQLPLPLHL